MPEAVADLRHRLQLARKQCQEIGRMPPRPAGLRSAVSAIAVAVMQRLMFWYAPAVQRTIGTITDVADDALRDLDRMIQQDAGRISALEGHLREMQAHFERRVREAVEQVERQLPAAIQELRAHCERQLQERAALLEARIHEQARALELERATTIGIEGDLREQTEVLQQVEEERRRKEEALEQRLRESGERLQLVRRETIENTQRLVRLLAQSSPEAPVRACAPEDIEGLDAIEAALESEIRGTRGEVEERWKVFLPLMPREGPVLDVGCGRGEWLELLRREGIPARGVEANRLMAAECRERLLDAEHADALDCLARTPDGSLGAVTVLRLVEQLPFRRLARLVDEVARVLRPGGTAIFEAPNPDNVLVAARRRSLPSEILRCLVEARGLETTEVLFLNPADEEDRVPEEGEGAVTRRFNRFFYGPRDYAVVSKKAAEIHG